MEELKPVAWIFQHEETGRINFADEQQIEWGFEKNNPRLQRVCALYAIPDTHRVVPVELLHAIEIDLSMECTNFDTLNKLRAIIDKENT